MYDENNATAHSATLHSATPHPATPSCNSSFRTPGSTGADRVSGNGVRQTSELESKKTLCCE
eukprot:6817640-Pyramimonas_sp.AAC.1